VGSELTMVGSEMMMMMGSEVMMTMMGFKFMS
jgi:hypothetical protein